MQRGKEPRRAEPFSADRRRCPSGGGDSGGAIYRIRVSGETRARLPPVEHAVVAERRKVRSDQPDQLRRAAPRRSDQPARLPIKRPQEGPPHLPEAAGALGGERERAGRAEEGVEGGGVAGGEALC